MILVVGSINTDLVVRSGRLPAAGETVLGGTFFQAQGGKGANQAVTAARLSNEPVTLIAAVGDDSFGRASLAALQAENLNCEHIKTVPGEASGLALIMVDEAGENAISVASGANLKLTPPDIDALPQSVFDEASVLLTCLETPLPTVARAIERARDAGVRTILNPAPAAENLAETIPLEWIDVLTPNRGETASLSQTDGDPVSAAAELIRRGAGSVIVTLGADGCLLAGAEIGASPITVPAFPVTAVDATGAGDAFNGALAVALSEGRSLEQAAHWASRAAALSVTRPGAQPSLPTRSELESFGE